MRAGLSLLLIMLILTGCDGGISSQNRSDIANLKNEVAALKSEIADQTALGKEEQYNFTLNADNGYIKSPANKSRYGLVIRSNLLEAGWDYIEVNPVGNKKYVITLLSGGNDRNKAVSAPLYLPLRLFEVLYRKNVETFLPVTFSEVVASKQYHADLNKLINDDDREGEREFVASVYAEWIGSLSDRQRVRKN